MRLRAAECQLPGLSMIDDDLFDQLCSGARKAIWDAYSWAWSGSSRSPPGEIEYIHALVSTGTRVLHAKWTPILASRRITLRVSGVFIHQTPQAHYNHPLDGTVSPELGDLLVVHDHLGSAPTRRAVLVQVKRSLNGVPRQKPDAHQEFLYKYWPAFELKGRGTKNQRFAPGLRDFGQHSSSGRYGLIADDAYPGAPFPPYWPYNLFPWTFSTPLDPVRTAGGEEAGSFLASMLYETAHPRGRRARILQASEILSPPMHQNNHFDVTIDELLRLTAAKILRFRRYTKITGMRGHTMLCFQSASTGFPAGSVASQFPSLSSGGDGRGIDWDVIAEDPEEEGGISTILIETSPAD